MTMFNRFLMVGTLTLVFALSASAGSTVYSSTNNISGQLLNFNSSISFLQFDPSLYGNAYGNATLTGVQLTLNGSVTNNFQIENLDAGSSLVDSRVNGIISLALTGPSDIVVTTHENRSYADTLPGCTVNCDPFADGFSPNYSGANAVQHINVTSDTQNSLTLSDSGSLAFFTGTGTLSLPVFAAGGFQDLGGNTVDSLTGTGSADGTVTYFYDVPSAPDVNLAPEPSSILLLGSALLGIASKLRKKAAN